MALTTKTVVTSAEGVAVEFGDFLSKFVAAHPKVAVVIAFGMGALVGHFI